MTENTRIRVDCADSSIYHYPLSEYVWRWRWFPLRLDIVHSSGDTHATFTAAYVRCARDVP